MWSKGCLFLLVLVLSNSASSIPVNEAEPTAPSAEVVHDHNVAGGDHPAGIGGQSILCRNTDDCKNSEMGEFSECKGTTCHCMINAFKSSTSNECLMRRGLGEGCKENQQCDELGSAECSSHICSCTAGARQFEKKCWTKKNIGENCNVEEECMVTSRDAKCKDHICACKDGMVPHSDGQRCLPVALNVGASCEETTQCTSELGEASCISGTCKCLDDSHEKNSACIKSLYLGDQCKNVEGAECYLPHSFGITRVECLDVCHCRDPYVESEDKKQCLNPGEKDPGTGGATSVYPFMASIVTVVAALILTS